MNPKLVANKMNKMINSKVESSQIEMKNPKKMVRTIINVDL